MADEKTPETTDQAPETTEAQAPEDELQVGELMPQEMMGIQQVRGRINQCLMEIGHLEVQKAMKLAQCDQLERQGQEIMRGARERLGLGQEETLQITPDGKIRKLPQNVVQMGTKKE